MTKDNVDVVVAYNTYYFSQIIFNHTLFYPRLVPKIFQLDKHYNINNIIIIGVNHVI